MCVCACRWAAEQLGCVALHVSVEPVGARGRPAEGQMETQDGLSAWKGGIRVGKITRKIRGVERLAGRAVVYLTFHPHLL